MQILAFRAFVFATLPLMLVGNGGGIVIAGTSTPNVAGTWKSWTREPKALKIEATCTPVAPPPTTNIDGGTAVRLQASLWVAVNAKPGTESRRLVPPAHRMILSACSRSPLAVSMVCGSTKRTVPACS